MTNTTKKRILKICSIAIPVFLGSTILLVAVMGPIINLLVDIEKKKLSIQRPQVTYAEFPFKLTYRVGDEIITVEDTYVCEFKGVKDSLGAGPYRLWETYIKSTGEDYITVIDNDETYIGIELYAFDECLYGEEWDAGFVQRAYMHSGRSFVDILDEGDAFLQGLEIVSFEHADPIDAFAYDDDILNYDVY